MNEIRKVLDIFNNQYNRQVVLYGPPGTSKTYSSTIIAANFLQGKTDISDIKIAKDFLKNNIQYKLVQFHPSYNYEDFVRGIKVEIKEIKRGEEVVNSIPDYLVVNKVFGQVAEDAQKEFEKATDEGRTPKNFVLVIDEINRAPVASVLGELIYGLEYRGQSITTPYAVSGGSEELVIPENLYIIATMNTADRSIGSIDYAVRRRFAFMSLPTSREALVNSWKEKGLGGYVAENNGVKETFDDGSVARNVIDLYDQIQDLFEKRNLADTSIQAEDIRIGHTYFLYDDEKCQKDAAKAKAYIKYRIEYQIMPVIEEYIKDGLINDINISLKKEEWLRLFG